MGNNNFIVNDPSATFGEESPRTRTSRRQLHLVLSPAGTHQLLDAVAKSEQRDRESVICIICGHKDTNRPRFRWARRLDLVIAAVNDDSDTVELTESDDIFRLRLGRSHVPRLKEMCSRMDNEADVAYQFGEMVNVWVWGDGTRP